MKTNQTFLNKVISSPQLEKFITAAFSKLKNIWLRENTHSGIQFYGDLED